MAKTWIDHETGETKIDGDVVDVQLAEVAITIGYVNRANTPLFDVIDELDEQLPEGYKIVHGKEPNGEWIRIGQVRVHHGDPDFPLYIVRKGERGRPPMMGEKLNQTGVWLQRKQIEFLRQRGNISEQVRALIDKEMRDEA